VPVSSGYTGHAHDPETALVQMQQRYYEPLAGRFLSVDPVVTDTTAGGGFNRYVYATSNPYRFVDPTGMSPEESSCSTSGASICHSHQIADTSSAGPTAASLIRATASVVTGGYSDQATEAAASGDALAATVYTIAGTAVAVVNGATLGNGSRILEVFGLAKGLTKADAVIAETLAGKGNFTSATKMSADDPLKAGEKFVGSGYKEIGKSGSGLFRSADGTRQFRIDTGSLTGAHKPGVPHGHLEIYKPGAAKPTVNNHIPFFD